MNDDSSPSEEWTDPRYARVVSFYLEAQRSAARRGRLPCPNCGGTGAIVMVHQGRPLAALCGCALRGSSQAG